MGEIQRRGAALDTRLSLVETVTASLPGAPEIVVVRQPQMGTGRGTGVKIIFRFGEATQFIAKNACRSLFQWLCRVADETRVEFYRGHSKTESLILAHNCFGLISKIFSQACVWPENRNYGGQALFSCSEGSEVQGTYCLKSTQIAVDVFRFWVKTLNEADGFKVSISGPPCSATCPFWHLWNSTKQIM